MLIVGYVAALLTLGMVIKSRFFGR
jgi:hypothetical protein